MTIVVIWRNDMTWAATQAKAKFSEILDKAETEGPQLVRRRKREFYVMTKDAFESLPHRVKHPKNSASRKPQNMAEFFRNSPLRDSGLDLERVQFSPRHIDF
jgi:prevent-host-death family protein